MNNMTLGRLEGRYLTDDTMLEVAYAEAVKSRESGGIPIGAAMFDSDGALLGRGHNRRVQEDDPSIHAETAAFRASGRQRSYADMTMVTTLSPCWYCSGLVRQFGLSRLIIGEEKNFVGGSSWLREHGIEVIVLDDPKCTELLADFISLNQSLWNEDIGVPG